MSDLSFTEVVEFDCADKFIEYLRPTNRHWGTHTECTWVFRGQWDAAWALIPSSWRDDGQSLLMHVMPGVRTMLSESRRVFGTDLEESYVCQRAAEHAAVLQFCSLADQVGYPVADSNLVETPMYVLQYLSDLNEMNGLFQPGTPFCIAQHHGVPTRLLDWTRHPLYAAFFACQPKGGNSPAHIAVWALDTLAFNSLSNFRSVTCPRHIQSFIHAQDGLFTSYALPGPYFRRAGRWPNVHEVLEEERLNTSMRVLKKATLKVDEVDKLRVLLWREGITVARMMPTYSSVSLALRDRWSLDQLSRTTGPLI